MEQIGTLDKLNEGATDLRQSYPRAQREIMASQVDARRSLLMDIHKQGVVRTLTEK